MDFDEDAGSGDEELLHGNIGPPVGCDPPPRQQTTFRGRYVAKEFIVETNDYSSLFCGIVGDYDQRTKRHSVEWEDDTKFNYTAAEVTKMRETFELWYARVSLNGRNMSRANAAPFMVKAHKREQVQKQANKANASAAASAVAASDDSSEDEEDRTARMSVYIMKMNVKDLRDRCDKLKLNSTGLKKDLRARLAQHYNCSLVSKETTTGKHACKWERKVFADECTKREFTDTDFNVASLTRLLPSFPDSMPSCGECYDFFHTNDMWELGLNCTNNYPRTIRSQMQPPPWHRANQPWPPVWTEHPWTFDMKQFKSNTAALYLLGLKHKGKDNLRDVFSTDPFYEEKWLKEITTRIQLEAFLRQLHYEDSTDPKGKRYDYSVNFRPNGVPKCGLLLEHFRRRSCLFRPETDLSFDEATAKYAGRMTKLKHLQSKYKPYDGIRLYSLNGSKTGYTNNFRVDLRDGTAIETMFASVLTPFEKLGYTVWGDNAFTTVSMLRQTKEDGFNFAGTTRTTYGFPKTLIDEELAPGEWRWLMSKEGFLSAFWADVGFVKLMSNFHTPESGQVLRRVTGKADKEARGAPTVGVEYNHFMGGTDLKDFVRGLYTTHRRGKKWWRCLYYWFLDTSMYNSFALYRWCWGHLKDTKFTMKFKEFIKEVTNHLLSWMPGAPTSPATPRVSAAAAASATAATPVATPTPPTATPTPRSATRPYRQRVTQRRTAKRRLMTTPYEGPAGETRAPLKRSLCVGADVRKTKKKRKDGKGLLSSPCVYCKHAFDRPRKPRDSVWVCELCGVPLHAQCNNKYHRWVNQE